MKLFKRNTILGMLTVMPLVLWYVSCNAQNDKPMNLPAITNSNKGFAVVELFTSEGCSSCPPADKLMEKLQQENVDKPVYIVAFHVDYWDRQGWKDTFSAAAFTYRQRRYADWLHLETIYTPQVVVNGTSEYVGSQEGAIVQAISRELNKGADATLALQGKLDGNKLHVEYKVTGHKENAVLLLALVQKNAQTQVRAGENEGRRLSHVQIVRQLVQAAINNNSTMINLPEGFNKEGWEVVGFVQRKEDGRITAAARLNQEAN
ncbi:DUF1223 domain-containing protein [Paraflavitalea devenefica]|uniref:DUF1223 domain-containing protein n=1 Tax=Paraflavitalea devenefica TaxID=2716334 RepID=UPI001FE7D47E|nr:DUF1223 domain-containing protein [Paraflavitalea devenefica]